LEDQLYRQLIVFSAETSRARVEKMNLSKAVRDLLERQLEIIDVEKRVATISK
jgi:hypothetical protein